MTPSTIQVNELFGPTIQGEGQDIGKPCLFVRLHHCPVKCPGCDTGYTWNGTETGEKQKLTDLNAWMQGQLDQHPGCGIVLSGGEPLIHYGNENFRQLLRQWRMRTWVSMETSGFVGPKEIELQRWNDMREYMRCFNTVHLSPKITPCLHGAGWTDEQLTSNVRIILDEATSQAGAWGMNPKLAFKFVVRDEEDVKVVEQFVKEWGIFDRWKEFNIPVFLMPYGVEPEEIISISDKMIPHCARNGFILSPRLHTLLWGKKRGV